MSAWVMALAIGSVWVLVAVVAVLVVSLQRDRKRGQVRGEAAAGPAAVHGPAAGTRPAALTGPTAVTRTSGDRRDVAGPRSAAGGDSRPATGSGSALSDEVA